MTITYIIAACHKLFQKNQQDVIFLCPSFFLSACLSVGLSKCGHSVIRFSLNILHLSKNNNTVRGGVIKAFLIEE